MRVPQHVIQLLADLRSYLQEKIEPPVYVSDRRLVKAVALMQVSVCCYCNRVAVIGPQQCQLSSACLSAAADGHSYCIVTGAAAAMPVDHTTAGCVSATAALLAHV